MSASSRTPRATVVVAMHLGQPRSLLRTLTSAGFGVFGGRLGPRPLASAELGCRIGVMGVGLALALSACGGAGAEVETHVVDAAATINAAMDGTQAVQDFLIYFGMSAQKGDGSFSYYDEVLDRAAEGLGESVALDGGMTLSPVDSLEGDVRSADGEVIPSVSLDFALLQAGPDAIDTDQAPLTLDGGDVNGRGLLVEIFTAEFAERRTHVGPGDVGAVDLTFVSRIAPGDDLSSAYILGQTFPGDPAEEAGLSPHDLFVYRWNLGLVGVFGDAAGMNLVIDDGVVAIEGSTIVLTEPKVAAIAEASVSARTVGLEVVEKVLEAIARGEKLVTLAFCSDLECDAELVISVEADGELFWRFDPPGDGEIGFYGDPGNLATSLVSLFGDMACIKRATDLISKNESAFGSGYWNFESSENYGPGEAARLYCEDPQPLGKTGGTFGDVHVTTFDGRGYDNHAAGEFLVFDNGTATVQMRLSPWEDSDAVSIVTAVAVGVGDHEVSMHQDNRIWIDGVEPGLQRGESVLVGDAALLWTGTGWVIVWPDGTEVRVNGGQHQDIAVGSPTVLNPLIMLVTSSDPNAVGMLGSPDGDITNEFVTRSGEPVDSDLTVDFEGFYSTYVDTWRINQEESLFHYENGETTDTFTIAGFPRVRYELGDLDPDVRADAEAACIDGGIERLELLEGCIFDVALTGDYGFVYDTYLVQSKTSAPVLPPTTETTNPPPVTGDGVNSVTVGPLTIGFGAEPPVVLPANVLWQCQATEAGFFAESRFYETEDRRYEISLIYQYADANPAGVEEFIMIIKRNGDEIAWMMTSTDPMSGSLTSVEVDGSTLTATGTAVLNDPYDPTLFVGANIPPNRIEPFTLQANCDR